MAKNENKKKNFEKEIEYLNKGHQFFYKSVNPKIFDQSLSYWLNIIPKKFGKFKNIEGFAMQAGPGLVEKNRTSKVYSHQ